MLLEQLKNSQLRQIKRINCRMDYFSEQIYIGEIKH